MRRVKLVFVVLGLVLAAVGSLVPSSLAQEQAVPSVPPALQGDWLMPSSPSPYSSPGMRLPDFPPETLRFSADQYLRRVHKVGGILGAYDQAGNPMNEVKDKNGKSYFEAQPFFVTVRTEHTPWQIDLWLQKDGQISIEHLGICSLDKDSLTLSLGRKGEPRPTSFKDPGLHAPYWVYKATRQPKQ